MIDAYLADLRDQLRVPAERIMAEVEDHLREGAARDGEDAAIARFGPAALVAERFHREIADRDAARSVRAVVLAGVVLFGLFMAVDFVQPRAPWPDRAMPLGLEWKLHVALLSGQVALAAGFVMLVQRNRLTRLRTGVVSLSAAAVALGFHVAFQFDRLGRVHHTRAFMTLAIATAVVRVVAVAAALLVAGRAARRVGRFALPGDGLLRHGWAWCLALATLAGAAVYAHDEATRARSAVDAALEATVVVAAYATLKKPMALASDAAYTVRRIRR